jgi:DNA-binding NtrC family response regulator
MPSIGILILDDDIASHSALEQMLDSEGWAVSVVTSPERLLPELAKGETRLVIANAARTGLNGPVFEILKALALAPAVSQDKTVARVLFLVPSAVGAEAQPALDKLGLPYLLKPYHLHDFLEKVSDLLMEAGALAAPMRQIRRDPRANVRTIGATRTNRLGRKGNTMFASREDYYMTEEELAEWEQKEAAEAEKKKKKQEQNPYLT